jgi:Helix-turn-helix domain
LEFGFSLSPLVLEHWRLAMACEPRVNFSMRELDRLKCIQTVIDGDLKPGQAAERLGLTVRQIERLVNRYRAEGPLGLISRHRRLSHALNGTACFVMAAFNVDSDEHSRPRTFTRDLRLSILMIPFAAQ